MKKSDLRTGMVVEDQKGDRSIVMLDTPSGSTFAGNGQSEGQTWSPMSAWDEDLIYKTSRYSHRNIAKVYQCGPSNMAMCSTTELGELLWERSEKIKQQLFNESMVAGKWYKSENNLMKFNGNFDHKGYPLGYGMSAVGWIEEDNPLQIKEGWFVEEEATDSEVAVMLMNEIQKRGLLGKWVSGASRNWKYKCTTPKVILTFSSLDIVTDGLGESLYKDGKFATLRDLITKKQAEEMLGLNIID